MEQSESLINELQSLLDTKCGIGDRTLAEYIVNLSKQGFNTIRKELADLPSQTIESIICLIKNREIHSKEEKITRANISDDCNNCLSAKRSSTDCFSSDLVPNVIVEQNIPDFLVGETSINTLSDPIASENITLPNPKSWLGMAAKHTSTKLLEITRDNDNNRFSVDQPTYPTQAYRIHRQSSNSGKKNVLPIHDFKHSILQIIAENPIAIIVGETGSGKTTQITQFLHTAGYCKSGKVIACTQPRRLAAISIAERVSQEMGCSPVGGKVGYTVRFDDCTSSDTEIKYMTDGILLREIISDRDLTNYSAIMLDEAHERTIATDVLFALLKAAVARRPELRVIVTSATLDAERFSKYFGDSPIIRIPGKTFPVTINYSETPILDYMEAAIATVNIIHSENLGESGDILVFLTGQSEIELAASIISRQHPQGDLYPVPVYSAIPAELQALIFDPAPSGKRKVVLATNIAETSLTIDGIKFVVDTGFVKVQAWDVKRGMAVLKVQPISQAQANQRSGRAGRVAPGVCYRLFTKISFKQEMSPTTLPEIQRENLAYTVLLLKNMGVDDILNFDFMDPPPRAGLLASLKDLYLLSAIDTNAIMTPTGVSMAKFPLEPALAKILVTAQNQNDQCLQDILTIIAMLSMPSVFYRPAQPATKRAEADRAHQQFYHTSGDHITLLMVYNRWIEAGYKKKWCTINYIHYKTLLKVKDARKQISDLVNQYANGRKALNQSEVLPKNKRYEIIIKTLCSGFVQNFAKIQRGNGSDYTSLASGASVSIHPSSVLFKKNVPYVLYSTVILTSKEYMHMCSQVQPEWLIETVPELYKIESENDMTKRQRAEVIKPLYNKFASHENEWRVSEHHRTLTRKCV